MSIASKRADSARHCCSTKRSFERACELQAPEASLDRHLPDTRQTEVEVVLRVENRFARGTTQSGVVDREPKKGVCIEEIAHG